jgi:tRNA (guanine-N7-)-methyltransferase
LSEPPTDPATAELPRPRRGIRSFVVRGGRMTVAQQRAWEASWPRYGREVTGAPIDLDAWFGRRARRLLEIGFGNGENLLALAAQQPDHDFLGIEVHRPGVGHLLLRCEELGLTNVRVLCHDATECVAAHLPAESFAEVLLYFPDPWPKKRHHKRRIVQPAFVAQFARVLEHGGVLRLATDWVPYAEHMRDVLAASEQFVNAAPGGATWSPRPASRPQTRFERRGERLGHEVRDLAYRRR